MSDVQHGQKKLSNIVKGVHAHLRIQLKESNGDWENAWKKHCQNEELLMEYADAMHRLAKDIWTKNPKTRIEWCRDVCMEYFFNGGLEKLHRKKERRRDYEISSSLTNLHSSEGINRNSKETNVSQTSCETCSEANYNPSSSPELSSNDDSLNVAHILLPFDRKIVLLDVGSCYDPFKRFDEFKSIALDLCPAVESVFQCDFLQLNVLPARSIHLPCFSSILRSPVTKLPRESFDVVVFSLLLEYLPSPRQRLMCCYKAHDLLIEDGLLIIITPDSHHQQRNAPMMKSWKDALELIGFSRWKYVKEEHLHCLAFQKTYCSSSHPLSQSSDKKLIRCQCKNNSINPDMLYIPQDRANLIDDHSKSEHNDKFNCSTISNSNPELIFMDGLNEIDFDD